MPLRQEPQRMPLSQQLKRRLLLLMPCKGMPLPLQLKRRLMVLMPLLLLLMPLLLPPLRQEPQRMPGYGRLLLPVERRRRSPSRDQN